jgi:hypothetical protein
VADADDLARAEGERRTRGVLRGRERVVYQDAFVAGAAWQRELPTTVTGEQVERARYAADDVVKAGDSWAWTVELLGFLGIEVTP